MEGHSWKHDRSMRVLVKKSSDSLEAFEGDLAGYGGVSGEALNGIGNVRAAPYHDMHELAIELGMGTAVRALKEEEFIVVGGWNLRDISLRLGVSWPGSVMAFHILARLW